MPKMTVLLTVGVFMVFLSLVLSKDPIVNTNFGKVQGQDVTTRGGRQVVQFLGIPYAKPPTGSLRFQSPEYPDKWNNVLNATKECSACIQQFMLPLGTDTLVSGSEDCLCVNVFTPSIYSSAKLPVIVWLHGGVYLGSSSTTKWYNHELMLDKDIVLVSMNFRIGIMGFLTIGDAVIPGNFGMKDQVLALKWVKENIAYFGGDPASVTLFGESSGAASVSLHQQSPLSKGLFHKAIQSSGSALNPWAIENPEVMKGRSAAAIHMVGCSKTKSADLLSCLQAVSAVSLVNTTHTFQESSNDISPGIIWGPTVEVGSSKDAFLVEDPRGKVQTATIPLLIGLNNAEGGYYSVLTLPIPGKTVMRENEAQQSTVLCFLELPRMPKKIVWESAKLEPIGSRTESSMPADIEVAVNFGLVGNNANQNFDKWNAKYEGLTPFLLLINGTNLDRPVVTKATRKYYFGSDSNPISPGQLQQITKMFGDSIFNIGILDEAEKRMGPTYLYHYNYNKTFSFCPLVLFATPTPNVGACHLDDLPNVFPMMGFASIYNTSDPDYILSIKIVEMWTNFAKNSNPSTSEISWKPVKSGKSGAIEYLEITNSGITMKSNLFAERRAFWKSLSTLKD